MLNDAIQTCTDRPEWKNNSHLCSLPKGSSVASYFGNPSFCAPGGGGPCIHGVVESAIVLSKGLWVMTGSSPGAESFTVRTGRPAAAEEKIRRKDCLVQYQMIGTGLRAGK